MRQLWMRRMAVIALALLLLAGATPVYPGGKGLAAEGAQAEIEAKTEQESYVRIKNMYTGDYLQAQNGKVSYGAPVETDRASHWIVKEHDGKQRLQNRETGLYMSIPAEASHLSPVELAEASDDPSKLWHVMNAVTEGYVVIQSDSESSHYVHIEDRTGYAQTSAIPPNWGTVQWQLEPVTEYVQFKNSYTGAYLTAVGGKVGYGDADEADPASHWVIEEDGGIHRIYNRQSGTYISTANWQGHLSPLELLDNADASDPGLIEWQIMNAVTPELVVIQHAADEGHYVHVEDKTGYAQSSSIPPNWGTVQWAVQPVTVKHPYNQEPPEEAPSYIRIQNDWLELYLFDDEGKLAYGNMQAGDARGHWSIEEDGGYHRLQNRETGRYFSLNGVAGDRTAVAVEEKRDNGEGQLWVIDNLETAGNKLIRSPESEGSYLHTEKKLGFAQYGPIPKEWGSPQWRFVPVKNEGPSYVRFTNDYTSKTLYEEDGKVKYGDPELEDASSHWLLADAGDGLKRVQNRLTGHYIHVEGMTAENDPHLLPLLSGTVEESWTSAKWTVSEPAAGLFVLTNAYRTDQVIHVQDATGYAQSSPIPSDWGSARWHLEPAPALLPIEVPEAPVRWRNAGNGTYLYENENGVVLYGDVEEKDGRSHWLLVPPLNTGEGYSLVNRATGHKVSSRSGTAFLESLSLTETSLTEQWFLEPAPDGVHLLIRSASKPQEYVHLKDRAGYAQQSLQSIESADLQWELQLAPEESIIGEPDTSSEPVMTARLADRRTVRIGQGNKVLTASGGVVSFEPAAEKAENQVWQFWDDNGYKLIQNTSTGHFLVWTPDGAVMKEASPGGLLPEGAYWEGAERSGDMIFSRPENEGMLLGIAGSSIRLEAGDITKPGSHQLFQLAPVRSDVVLEAEEAFVTGNVQASKEARGYSGDGFIEGFKSKGDSAVFAVYADEADTYSATLRYANGAKTAGQLSVSVNGLHDRRISFASTGGWDDWQEQRVQLPLRKGLNTVTLEYAQGVVPLFLDQLTIQDAVPPAYRGASLDYTLYEAEHAMTNAAVLEASRTYKSLASEASGRQAVMLEDEGDYVQFTLHEPANRLTIRYAIPDSEDGAGLETPIGLYVNGQKQEGTTLSSRYAWVYGSYPWTNNPADGDAHRFYDEASFAVKEVPAGAEIRIAKEGDAAVSYVVIDLLETALADAPYAMPEGYLSVLQYGAIADDGKDDRAAFVRTIEAAKKAGKGVWIPAGRYELEGGPLEIADVTIRGAGKWHTLLAGSGFMGVGDHIRVYDLAIDGEVDARRDELEESGFDGAFGKGSTIQHVRIERTKTGIWSTAKERSDGTVLHTEGLYVAGVQIRNTYADGINFSTGTQRSMAEQLSIRNTGDDGMALWASGEQSAGNIFRFNTVELPWLSNNIAVYGGKDVQVTDNIVSDTVAFGAGISISTRHMPELFEGKAVVARNTMIRTGSREHNWPADFGGMFLFAGDKPMTGDIRIHDNIMRDSTYQGISFLGEQFTEGMVLDGNVVDGAGTWGIHASGNITGLALMGNTLVRDARVGPYLDGAAGLTLVKKDYAYNFMSNSFYATLGDSAAAPFHMETGQTALAAAVLAAGGLDQAKADWGILHPSIATVSEDGTVTALRGGKTMLTAEFGGGRRYYSLIVSDKEAPAWGADAALEGRSGAAGSVSLRWPAASDNSGIASYRIVWDTGYLLVEGSKQEASIAGLPGGSRMTFTVEARDEGGNWTEAALSVQVSVQSTPNTGQPGASGGNDDGLLEGDHISTKPDGTKAREAKVRTEAFVRALAESVGQGRSEAVISMGAGADEAALIIPAEAVIRGYAAAPNGVASIRFADAGYALPLELLKGLLQEGGSAAIRVLMKAIGDSEAQQLSEKTDVALKSRLYSFELFLQGEDGSAVPVREFGSSFITRTIPVAEGISPDSATGVVFDEGLGRFRHVPTVFRMKEDGTQEAIIRSVTNSTYAVIDEPKAFEDVEKHWSRTEVNAMASRLIVNGMEDGSFYPDEAVTRAQFLAMLTAALGLPGKKAEGFTDVITGSWYEPAVGAASAYELVTGYGDGTWRPDNRLTREELVVLLMRAYRLTGASASGETELDGYADQALVASWAAKDMSAAAVLGLVEGKPGMRLDPKGTATRAEAAALISRMLEKRGFIGNDQSSNS